MAEASPALAPVTGSAWRPIKSIPKDGTPVLVCSPGMSYPEVAWFEKNGGVMKTFELWMPLPAVPNTKFSDAANDGGKPQ
jgi:hypothetical protein